MKIRIGPREPGNVPGWWCDAEVVGGQRYRIGIIVIPMEGGRPDTWGIVREANEGKILWQERVPGSIAPKDLLMQGLAGARAVAR